MRDDEARRARAASRVVTFIRKTRVGDGDDPAPLRGEAAVSLVTQLTREAWEMSGRPWPEYARADTPYRFVRRDAP